MKPIENRGKLQLKKHAVARLSDSEQAMLRAGMNQQAAITTSFAGCSGWTCCKATETCEIWKETIVIVVKTILA